MFKSYMLQYTNEISLQAIVYIPYHLLQLGHFNLTHVYLCLDFVVTQHMQPPTKNLMHSYTFQPAYIYFNPALICSGFQMFVFTSPSHVYTIMCIMANPSYMYTLSCTPYWYDIEIPTRLTHTAQDWWCRLPRPKWSSIMTKIMDDLLSTIWVPDSMPEYFLT